jgi:hypothetical protein
MCSRRAASEDSGSSFALGNALDGDAGILEIAAALQQIGEREGESDVALASTPPDVDTSG